MKTLFYKNNEVILEDTPIPEIGSGEVLVANAYSVVSIGSELFSVSESSLGAKTSKRENIEKVISTLRDEGVVNVIRKVKNSLGSESPLGYSSSGIVLKIGKSIKDIAAGDMVACMGMGKAVHGEIVAMPRNLVSKLPEHCTDLRQAAFGAIGCIGLNAVRKLNPQIGDKVVVLGTGLIGLTTLLLLRLTGAKTICLDIDGKKLEKAKELGADYVLNPHSGTFINEFGFLTNGFGADAVIIAAGGEDSELLNQALGLIRSGGKLVLLGKAPIGFNYDAFFKKDITFLISRSYGPGRYDLTYEERGVDYPFEYVRWTEGRNLEEFLDIVASKKIDFGKLVSHEINIEEAPRFYKEKFPDAFGVVIRYRQAEDPGAARDDVASFVPNFQPRRGKIRVGVIGLGDFSKNMLLPALARIDDFQIQALATRKPYDFPKFIHLYAPRYVTTEAEKLMDDPEIDLIFVTTPNNTHASFILQCAKHGKPCFVEKPLCVTKEECDELKTVFLNGQSPVPLFVGFNRRFAPLSLEIKKILDSLSGPAVINYTVNAGYMDPNNWMQDNVVGGGRLISEVCHFVDYGMFLTGGRIERRSLETITPNGANIKNYDNFVISLKFSDQSLMTITYNSIGNKKYPKEFIQIFKTGFVLEVSDFKTLSISSEHGAKEIKLKAIDKGHASQYGAVARFLRGDAKDAFSLRDIFETTEETLALNNLLHQEKRF